MRSFSIAMAAFAGFLISIALIITLTIFFPFAMLILLMSYPCVEFTLFCGDVANNFANRRGWRA